MPPKAMLCIDEIPPDVYWIQGFSVSFKGGVHVAISIAVAVLFTSPADTLEVSTCGSERGRKLHGGHTNI